MSVDEPATYAGLLRIRSRSSCRSADYQGVNVVDIHVNRAYYSIVTLNIKNGVTLSWHINTSMPLPWWFCQLVFLRVRVLSIPFIRFFAISTNKPPRMAAFLFSSTDRKLVGVKPHHLFSEPVIDLPEPGLLRL